MASEIASGNHAFFCGQIAGMLSREAREHPELEWTVEVQHDGTDYRPVVKVTTRSGTVFSVIIAEVPGTNPDPPGV